MDNYEKTRFTETQIVKATQEHENCRDAKDICRELQITTSAFYKWRKRYGGLDVRNSMGFIADECIYTLINILFL